MFERHRTYAGLAFHESNSLTVPVGKKATWRSWRERLFTLPWRPWRKFNVTTLYGPDPDVYIVGSKIVVGHPVTLNKIKQAIENERTNSAPGSDPVLAPSPTCVDGQEEREGDRILRPGGPGWDLQSGVADAQLFRASSLGAIRAEQPDVDHSMRQHATTAATYAGTSCSLRDIERVLADLEALGADTAEPYAFDPFGKFNFKDDR